MKQFLTVAKNLLFPPHCAGCHALLPPTVCGEAAVFCPDCKKEWRAELCRSCPTCFAAYPECRCQPSALGRAGSEGLLKLAPYGDTARERVMRHIVLSLKKHPRRRILAMLAGELSDGILAQIEKLGWQQERVLLVHLPRDPRSVRRFGVDQSACLARAIADQTGLSHLSLLRRTKRVRAQKKLNAKQRALNLRDAFAVGTVPKDCCVVLIDDVVTTGASLSAGVHALRAAGVKNILCVAVAQTPKKH